MPLLINVKQIFIFRLKQLLSMYRVQFDFIDVVLAKRTSLKTMANFTTLWNQQFINQGNITVDNFILKLLWFLCLYLIYEIINILHHLYFSII